ncbi:uncharacterized protein LOC128226121 [Mya arenaria]|uniref:uncharacterized protein LOC128226121 n=1 Tax=Mya arenaria TaxID=6604 RepID=UPI0022E1A407|nr:uncharacterized protein LOC128226121 [Mya arenaria]
MPLTKEGLEKAKKRRNERLSGWIRDVRQENEFGIPRLQNQFRHIFQKIEWVPKTKDKIKTKEDIGNGKSIEEQSIMVDMKSTGPGTVSRELFTCPLEDYPIHDSNSSNLSSSIGHSREEIRVSERKTPFNKTPLLIADDNLTENFKSRQNSTMPGHLKGAQGRWPSILQEMPSFQKRCESIRFKRVVALALKREKREKRKRSQGTAQVANITEEWEEEEQTEEVAPLQSDAPVNQPAPDGPDAREQRRLSIDSQSQKLSIYKKQPANKGGGLFKIQTKAGPLEVKFERQRKKTNKVTSKVDLSDVKMTSEERRQAVLENFRRLVRILIHIRVLLNVSRLRIQEEEKSKEFKRFEDGVELSFDPSDFKSALSYGGLSSRARHALRKDGPDRTDADARVLMDVMMRLPMFAKYPKSVRHDLTRTMWYDDFQDGRVILRQGDPGSRMYFIVSGELDLMRRDVLDTGEEMKYHIKTLRAGATFGELALIRNMRREYTAVCKGKSEFLSLSEAEFNQALRSHWERDCNLRFDFMRGCEHFKAWTDRQLQICADSSDLKDYKNNTVILGDIDGPTDSVYFVVKGQCEIVRRIKVVRHQSPYIRPNILLPSTASGREGFLNKAYARSRRFERDEVRFLTVTTLMAGNYFGVGENLRDTFVLARGKTQCALINVAQFSIMGKSEQLRRLKSKRENSIPSNKTLYEKFQGNRKWYEYRNKLLQEVVARKRRTNTASFDDVPRSEMTRPSIPKDLIYYKHNSAI